MALLTNFLNFDTILAEFTKILKENLCESTDGNNLQEDANYILSKLELCNICLFEEYVSVFKKYFYLLDPTATTTWLDQFFHKLPNPWDELAIKGYPDFLQKIGKTDNLGFRINYVLRLIASHCLDVKAKKQVKNQITNSKYGQRCCDRILKENWKIGCSPPSYRKKKNFRKRKFQWKPWKKNKKFSKKKKYVRKKKPINNFKKKNCRCFICNEEGHYAPDCPKKGKSAKKMIKVLEKQDFEIIFGEEISDEEEILFEISSDEENSSEEELSEYIFMMQNENAIQEVSQDELEDICLKDIVGEEITLSESELSRFEKLQTLSIPEIYKVSRFNFFSARVFEHYGGNTKAQFSSEGKIDIPLFNKRKIARWKEKYPHIQYIHIGVLQITITALFRQRVRHPYFSSSF